MKAIKLKASLINPTWKLARVATFEREDFLFIETWFLNDKIISISKTETQITPLNLKNKSHTAKFHIVSFENSIVSNFQVLLRITRETVIANMNAMLSKPLYLFLSPIMRVMYWYFLVEATHQQSKGIWEDSFFKETSSVRYINWQYRSMHSHSHS